MKAIVLHNCGALSIRSMIVRDTASLPPGLRPFVKRLWFADESARAGKGVAAREHVLPTGMMSLVFRVSDHPLRLFDTDNHVGRTIGHAIVGGARTSFYVRDISQPTRSVGAQLHPGAAEFLLGAPAGELAEQHTRLDDLWGCAAAHEARERLALASTPDTALDLLQTLLIARLPRVRAIHPAVAHALARFATTGNVNAVVGESGYCHRRFIALFRESVGLAPKVYCRIARLQTAIDQIASDAAMSWADLAALSGYSDQPHFTRDFRAFTGLTPAIYRRIKPAATHHVPIGGDPSDSAH